jgi:hypothetical protein
MAKAMLAGATEWSMPVLTDLLFHPPRGRASAKQHGHREAPAAAQAAPE